MGVDFARMQLDAAADLREVRAWVTRHNAGFPNSHTLLPPRPDPPYKAGEDYWNEHYGSGYFHVPALEEEPRGSYMLADDVLDHAALRRVQATRASVLLDNPLVPVEWRYDVCGIVLPDDLAGHALNWRQYLEDVRSGRHRAYLFDLFLYHARTDACNREYCEDFEFALRGAEPNQARFKDSKEFEDLCKNLLNDGVLEWRTRFQDPQAFPYFDQARHAETITTEQRITAYEHLVWLVRIDQRIRCWNGQVKTKARRLHFGEPDFDAFVARNLLDNRWLNNFLSWCDILVDDGAGLFLWA